MSLHDPLSYRLYCDLSAVAKELVKNSKIIEKEVNGEICYSLNESDKIDDLKTVTFSIRGKRKRLDSEGILSKDQIRNLILDILSQINGCTRISDILRKLKNKLSDVPFSSNVQNEDAIDDDGNTVETQMQDARSTEIYMYLPIEEEAQKRAAQLWESISTRVSKTINVSQVFCLYFLPPFTEYNVQQPNLEDFGPKSTVKDSVDWMKEIFRKYLYFEKVSGIDDFNYFQNMVVKEIISELNGKCSEIFHKDGLI